mmetsp:Transcript_11222/g.27926  ORF Transcript_11222/g.27926 Transcript_11222/m.27926 type:complete len:243 (-) Transcript_11222:314-1042(-)
MDPTTLKGQVKLALQIGQSSARLAAGKTTREASQLAQQPPEGWKPKAGEDSSMFGSSGSSSHSAFSDCVAALLPTPYVPLEGPALAAAANMAKLVNSFTPSLASSCTPSPWSSQPSAARPQRALDVVTAALGTPSGFQTALFNAVAPQGGMARRQRATLPPQKVLSTPRSGGADRALLGPLSPRSDGNPRCRTLSPPPTSPSGALQQPNGAMMGGALQAIASSMSRSVKSLPLEPIAIVCRD